MDSMHSVRALCCPFFLAPVSKRAIEVTSDTEAGASNAYSRLADGRLVAGTSAQPPKQKNMSA